VEAEFAGYEQRGLKHRPDGTIRMVPVPPAVVANDLRHAALSLWLNAGGDPAQIAARAGHSVAVLLTAYSHCIHGQDDLLNQQISQVLEPVSGLVRARPWEASGYTDHATGADAVRYASVTSPPGPPPARRPRRHPTGTATPMTVIYPD
jgi:hypothetical protein